MKKNVIIASAAVAAAAASIIAYYLLRKKKRQIGDLDAQFHNMVPKVKNTVKHVTKAFQKAKQHLHDTHDGHLTEMAS